MVGIIFLDVKRLKKFQFLKNLLFRTGAKRFAALVPQGSNADGAARGKGDILSRERISPLGPPREREGITPRPPTLPDLGLKNCTRCAIGCGVHGFAMNLLRIVTDINRALLS